MNKPPSVAIIMINWNNYTDTKGCLESLRKLKYPSFKVFLVDNGSTDDSFTKLSRLNDKNILGLNIDLVALDHNLGFAGGNNVGTKKAIDEGFEYLWLLNNDTEVDPNALKNLVHEMISDDRLGIVGSKIFYYNSDKIWFAGGLVNTWTGKTTHIGYKELDRQEFQYKRYVDYITGCSMLINVKMFRDIGLMYEDYFLYYEETDLNLRASQNNWKIMFVPDSIIYHKVSVSTGGESNRAPIVTYYKLRNAFWMIYRTQKFQKIVVAYLYLLYNAFKNLVKIPIKHLNKKVERMFYISKAIGDAFKVSR